jgi:hypothetical protein
LRFGRRERQSYSLSDFQDKVRESYRASSTLSKRQELAAQLYSEGYFQFSNAARLIVLVSAIEALAEPALRSTKSLEFVSGVLAALPSADLDESDRRRLVNSIGNLRRESISSTCTALVTHYADVEQAETFAGAYRTRSRMVHAGNIPSEAELDQTVFTLDNIVRAVIVRHINAGLQSNDKRLPRDI